jgi:two-component system sensor histidine kinase KdpD
MENAAKFSPAGEPVSKVRRATRDGKLRIDVATVARAFPKTNARASSTCSTAWSAATAAARAPAWGLTISQGMIGAHGGGVEALPGRWPWHH